MITEKDIKPIPKAMLGKIKKLDRQHNPAKNNRRRFYKYFTRFNRELCEVTVAVRDYKNKWYCKQVVVHELHGEKMFGQDGNTGIIGKMSNQVNFLIPSPSGVCICDRYAIYSGCKCRY